MWLSIAQIFPLFLSGSKYVRSKICVRQECSSLNNKVKLSFLGVLQVMTPNPECASLDTTLVDALHTMHDGKFLHLPVTDRGK